MCPGGYVVNASSEKHRLAVNGMSYHDRAGENANSAVIVTVTPDDFGSDHPLAGISFQRSLEKKLIRQDREKFLFSVLVTLKRIRLQPLTERFIPVSKGLRSLEM